MYHLTEHGLPPEIYSCFDEIKSKGIEVSGAWELLPQNESQVYEEALGPARYGILIDRKEQAAVILDVMRAHAYPGPLSHLKPREYAEVARAGWKQGTNSYETTLGTFVVQGLVPVLNVSLRTKRRDSLTRELTTIDAKARQLEIQNDALSGQIQQITAQLADASRRDALKATASARAEAIRAYAEIKKEYPGRIAHYEGIEQTAKDARGRVHIAELTLKGLNERMTKLDQELGALVHKDLTSVERRVIDTSERCKDYFESLRDEAVSSKYHFKEIEKLNKRLETAKVPTEADIKALREEVARLDAQFAEQTALVTTKQELFERAEANQKELEQRMITNIQTAFRRVKKDVEDLARSVGFEARLTLVSKDEQFQLEYEVAFHNNPNGSPKFLPIKNSADSTGEGAKAALVFCLAMSDPQSPAWYFLDEPAQNFSPKNVVNMFRILNATNAQVVLTSTRDQDYGDVIDLRQYTLRDLVDDKAPAPSTIRYNNKVAA